MIRPLLLIVSLVKIAFSHNHDYGTNSNNDVIEIYYDDMMDNYYDDAYDLWHNNELWGEIELITLMDAQKN